MTHFGEIISLIVAILWTATAIVSEITSRRIGNLAANAIRLILAISMIFIILVAGDGWHLVSQSNLLAWTWLAISGLVGFTFGDFFLYRGYNTIGSRYTQLFMTLAAPFAALASWVLLGERMTALAWIGMLLTVVGIGMAIMGKSDAGSHKLSLKLPIKGIFFASMAALGQGVGLVLSKLGVAHMPDDSSTFMQSFAGTFIRGLAGLAGFMVLLVMRGQQKNLLLGLKGNTPLLLIAAAIGGPTLGVTLSLLAVQYTDVGIAQTIMSTTPILILIPAYFIYHQQLTVREVVGAIISVVGVSLFFA